MSSAVKKLAIGLNLFYNFKTDFRHFTNFEVTYTYIYIAGFVGTTILLGLQFFQSTHLSFHCHEGAAYADVCPSEFALCSCPGEALRTNVCNGTLPHTGCTCCAYGKLELRSGVLLFVTHLGGLYTFTMGVSIVLLALVRLGLSDAPKATEPADKPYKPDRPPDVELCRVTSKV
jgi:hypothetical protein